MIVVKVELWPHGLEDEKAEIGEILIKNNLSGTPMRGNYDYELLWGKQSKSGCIVGHKREQHVFILLQAVLNDALGDGRGPKT
jgi:hypothetical protein